MSKFVVERYMPGPGAWTSTGRAGFAATRIAGIRAAMDPTAAEG